MSGDVIQQWLILARQDLDAAERLLQNPPLPSVVAVHCQQCVEKCLKALLEHHQIHVPRTHDLVHLARLSYQFFKDNLELDPDILTALSTVYLDCRYPSGHGLLPSGQPSVMEVIQFYAFSERVFIYCSEQLSQ
ncbi:MAG: HEPN domain-containing protein [Verrucomicrobia bacterium]|nr:HEPN domain-containing protein [Verrucomicrobiota bacterium]